MIKYLAICIIPFLMACETVDKAKEYGEQKYRDAVNKYCATTDPAEQARLREWSDEVTDPHKTRIECASE